LPPGERAAIAFFGIRGIGSIYYLAFALDEADFSAIPELWAMVALTILGSTVLHGVSASPILRRLDHRRRQADGTTEGAAPGPT
jgi:NhaP-type Na+/H+ or K+/H+ antiporter